MASDCFVLDAVMVKVQDVIISVDFDVGQVFNSVNIIMIPFQF
jgi:hypothetical protein